MDYGFEFSWKLKYTFHYHVISRCFIGDQYVKHVWKKEFPQKIEPTNSYGFLNDQIYILFSKVHIFLLDWWFFFLNMYVLRVV
jgi:hypothetical protein